MPKDFIYETAVTIDHEDGIMLVDTTVSGMASQLKRCGFDEITKPDSRPYRRFRGQADQIRFRKPKGQRTSSTGRRFVPGTRRSAQNPAQISTRKAGKAAKEPVASARAHELA